MAVVTQAPTTQAAQTGAGLTNPTNGYSNDGIYATGAPGKNTTLATKYGTFGFGAQIPSGAIIDKVQIIEEHKVSTTSSIATCRTYYKVSGVAGSNNDDATEPAADTTKTYNVTAGRSWTRADLLDGTFEVVLAAVRGNSGTAVTMSFDYVAVEVTYHMAYTQSLSDTMTLADSPVKTAKKALTDSMTMAESVADMVAFNRSLTDTMTMADSLVKTSAKTLSDALSLADSSSQLLVITQILTDTVALTESNIKALGLSKTDSLILTDALVKSAVKALADTFTLADVIAKRYGLSEIDTLLLADTIADLVGKRITDTQTIADAIVTDLVTGAKNYTQDLADTLVIADAISKISGKRLSDTQILADAASKVIGKAIADTESIADSFDRIWGHIAGPTFQAKGDIFTRKVGEMSGRSTPTDKDTNVFSSKNTKNKRKFLN